MDRIRISISGLMVVVAVSGVVMASLRANSGAGVNLVFCIALALNFAAVTVLPVGLAPRLRFAALGYAIGGWGWMVLIVCVPRIDSFLHDSVIVPYCLEKAASSPSPVPFVRASTAQRLALLCHSLVAMALGTAGAAVAWKLCGNSEDETITTPTTGLP